MTHAASLHSASIVFNALDCTPIRYADQTYVDKLVASGVTAVNHAVSYSEDLQPAMKAITDWRRRLSELDSPLFPATGVEDVHLAKKDGRIAWFVGFEDTRAFGGELWPLEAFHQLGLRFLGLTYQRRNLAGDGCGEPANAGLSQYGREIVRLAGELGVLLDLSHTGERSTLEAIELSDKPLLVTHAGLRHFVDSPRNKSDAEVRALAAKGGVFGVAAKSGFLHQDGLRTGTNLDTFVDNIDYLVGLVGIDHVIVGTDNGDLRKYTREGMASVRRRFPEIPIIGDDLNLDTVHPEGLADPKDLPNITHALVRRGYSDEHVEQILGGNLLRVLGKWWS